MHKEISFSPPCLELEHDLLLFHEGERLQHHSALCPELHFNFEEKLRLRK